MSEWYTSSDAEASTSRRPEARQVYSRGERGINSVTLVGRVGGDAEVRGSEQNPVTVFSLATSKTIARNDEFQQFTDWHRIAVFRPGIREYTAKSIKKGHMVYVQGAIRYSDYAPPGNDQPVKVANIIADDVMILSRPQNEMKEDSEDGIHSD